MPHTTKSGTRIHWQEEGAGPPLLLIMGFRYSSRLWYPALPELARHYRVIRFDNRGTGGSGAALGFGVGDMAEDAAAVMDAAGVASAHVYGVSMGGGIAMELALRHPARVRSLVLGCTMIKASKAPLWMALLPLLLLLPAGLGRRLLARSGPEAYGSAAPPEAVALDRRVVEGDAYSRRGVAAQMWAVQRYAVAQRRVAGLRVPALVLHGDEDRLVPWHCGKALAETLPHARLETLRGAGHNYFMAAGAQANRAAIGFLRRQEAGA
jgi:pimeloyl-ACP methyl ester carboxylesterase